MFTELKEAIKEVEDGDHELVMADECLFNQKHVVKNTWSTKGKNVTPRVMLKHQGCIAAVGAISAKSGLIHTALFPKSVKGPTFLEFVRGLRQKKEGVIYLLLDNASIHRTKVVREYCDKNEIRLVWNVPYCPQFNGIEEYWAIAKKMFKRRILAQLLGAEAQRKIEETVQECLDRVPHAPTVKVAGRAQAMVRGQKACPRWGQ